MGIADVYAAKGAGNLSLVDLGINLLGSTTYTFALPSVTSPGATPTFIVDIPSSQITSGAYEVPSDGIYHINYSFRMGQGVSAELLSGTSRAIVITKTTTSNPTTPTLLDSREFGSVKLLDLTLGLGLGLVVANISLTQGQISHIYRLKKGDKLRFGMTKGGVALDLIADKSTEISIHRIR